MSGVSSRGVLRQLDALFRFGTTGDLSDGELLERFVARRDDVAEAAFSALVERYGPMVLGVCCRVLGDQHEAEDAFQATFLVLARKAAAIARRERLANWLFGVACRTALDARARATRRQAREKRVYTMSRSQVKPADDDGHDFGELRVILDEELARLPERYRGALVLCELDGLSRKEAARRLDIPEGTLSSRLARAKDLLRQRLARRGLALSAIALELALAREARAVVVPIPLADFTIQAATRVAAGVSMSGVVSTPVATLTDGVLKAMFLAKLKGIALGLAAVAVITTGVGVMGQFGGTGGRSPSDDDRLGALERKLDRILGALGGSREEVAKVPPEPVKAEASKKAAFSDAAAPEPVPAKGLGAYIRSEPALPDRSGALAARMDVVEQRLAELERRFNELERRFAQTARRSAAGKTPSQDRSPFSSDLQAIPK
jgi:RNA polymerase sigma factor (sigma-70 family)